MNNLEKWQVLLAEMQKRYPVLSGTWNHAVDRFGQGWLEDTIPDIESVYGEISVNLSKVHLDLLDCYAEFANDSMRSQVFYERNGRYQASSYEDVKKSCYLDEEHMNRRYLPGMFLSHYFWPQHYHMLKGFKTLVLPRIKNAQLFYEVGVGCGIYSKVTLQELPNIKGIGFDISRYSLEYTQCMLGSFNVRERYSVLEQDIRFGQPVACDFLICQEVLEHLENPAEFCNWLSGMMKVGGLAYITAALNAGHSDHIYLFHTPSELEEMVRAAGLQPLHMHEEFAPGSKERNKTPSLCGFLARKNG